MKMVTSVQLVMDVKRTVFYIKIKSRRNVLALQYAFAQVTQLALTFPEKFNSLIWTYIDVK